MPHWSSLTVAEVVRELETDPGSGLRSVEAAARLDKYGPNKLIEDKPRSLLVRLLGQFKDFLVLILIASTVIAAVMGEILDAAVILGIVILNAILGVIQEGRAERALAALRRMAVPEASVIRDGRQARVPSHGLVPGDLVVVQAGDVIPADLRLTEAVNLKTDESPLTGESLPVEKDAAAIAAPDASPGDQPGMAFLGTTVVYGRGRGVVVRTGMETEIGKIAAMVASVEEQETPLQAKLAEFGKWLGLACLAICALVFAMGILRAARLDRQEILEMFMTAVSLAVAAIPEGLPAMVTIVLALGVQRMIARNAIIRRLPAVETLGCATYVCSDKTGTLTENKMTVTHIHLARGESIQVGGQGYRIEGGFTRKDGIAVDAQSDPDLRLLLRAALACNDADLVQGEDGSAAVLGDPTEAALVVLAAKAGIERRALEEELPRRQEIPFDSARKRMTTVHAHGGGGIAFTKGAPDLLLKDCRTCLADGAARELTAEDRAAYAGAIADLGLRGLRVLGLAYRDVSEGDAQENWDKDLCFLGLVGMHDPIRQEARAAVATCLEAGIRPVIVTGDFPQTARAIAAELGLDGAGVLTGAEIEDMTREELGRALGETHVFARVSPEHKLRIVEALRGRGEVVAMTGDGVNDAPALRSADIGVAMGQGGTEVAKGASDMVLADDNFATIVSAIEEGRVIYENIRKAVIYLLSCNIGELLLFFLAIVAGLPRPLLPVQILLINLVTDGLPALALGVEPKERSVMNTPPRNPKEGILNRGVVIRLVIVGVLIAVSALAPFVVLRALGYPDTQARAAAFITLALAELLRVFSSRSERVPWWRRPFFSNPQLIAAVGSSFLLIMGVLYLPPAARLFQTAAPTAKVWGLIAFAALWPMLGAEAVKWFSRRRSG